jgi:hypothetical protein
VRVYLRFKSKPRTRQLRQNIASTYEQRNAGSLNQSKSRFRGQAIVKDFFDAFNATGLGELSDETKTAKVLDFNLPGR